jgi:Flp pilus assembly CpaF family ATPase
MTSGPYPTPADTAGLNAAEIADELRMLTHRGMLGDYLTRPIREALARMLGEPDLPLSVLSQLDWYGPLELWRSPEHEVSDIIYNGPRRDPFFVIQRGVMSNTGVTAHPSWIAWTQRQLLLRGGKIDLAGDGIWQQNRTQGVSDGMRYLITAEPYSRDGGSIAIRMLPERWRTLDDLVQGNVLPREAADVLLFALQSQATVLVGGSTGSGKTTLTAGFTQELGKRARLIFVEDGGELPRTANSVHLEVNSEEVGAFTRAIKDTLRMKPDYVIVGEVRGGEAMAMLQAAATGHPGIGTIHAMDTQSGLRNLERMAMLGLAAEAGGGQSAAQIVRGLITSDSISLIFMHVGKTPTGRRSVLAIEEVLRQGAQGQSGDRFPTNALFQYDANSDRLLRVGNVDGKWGNGRM